MHGSGSPAGGGSGRFVEWEETFVSNDRGNRVVHYFLKDRQGQATLAVVGTERSVRHMVYVVCDDFLPDKTNAAAFKWRARREVVDWLTSLLSKSCVSSPCRSNSHVSVDAAAENVEDNPDGLKRLHDSKKTSKNVLWVGSSWTCRKRLKHYKSFRRNGITISVKSFVFVMSEEREHHIAYIEDMYEDKKLQKKLRVRWFHKTSELVCRIPAPPPHPREVFFTQFPQVISVECVDGLATVLAPEHFEKCPMLLPDSLELIHVCSRQFHNDGIKPLNICDVEGYWEQKALSALGVSSSRGTSDLGSDDDDDENAAENAASKGPLLTRYRRKRHSSSSSPTTDGEGNGLSDMDLTRASFEVGDRVEILCQDSGVRGCWFTGVIIGKTSRRVKVRYDELQDDDGKEKLEEWVSTSKRVQLDKMNIHDHKRYALRPSPPPTSPQMVSCSFGSPVDVWWNDGWWEGVVIGQLATDEVRVYFPGESMLHIGAQEKLYEFSSFVTDEGEIEVFKTSELRVSRDWVNGQWCDVKASDAVTALSVFWGCKDPLAASQSCRYENRYGEANLDRLISIAEAAEELRDDDDDEEQQNEDEEEEGEDEEGGDGDDNADKFLIKSSTKQRKRRIDDGGLKCKHSKEASVEESDCELEMDQEGWKKANKKAKHTTSIRNNSSTIFGNPLPPVASLVMSR